MDIILMDTRELIQGVEKIKSVDDITDDCRMFYELVHGVRKQGVFIEINDVPGFKKLEKKLIRKGIHANMEDPGYIEHHNFVIKPNTK
jgi:hypothetical protein